MMLTMEKFSQSLVEMEINVCFEECFKFFEPRQLKFPKLKKLCIISYAHKLLPMMETNLLSDFKFGECADECADHISDFLKKQHCLKRLTITETSSHLNRINFRNVTFALTSLSLEIRAELSPTAKFTIHSLLRNMSDSLEIFEASNVLPEDVKLVVNELPKLKTFMYGFLEEPENDILVLKRNTSITALEITRRSLPSIPKNLILALENLRTLGVDYDSMRRFKEDFMWIVKNAPKLEVLKCMYINQVDEIQTYYELLKTQDDSINQNINICTSLEKSYSDTSWSGSELDNGSM